MFIVLVCLKYLRVLTNELRAIGVYGLISFLFQLLQFIAYFFIKGKSQNIVANIYLPAELLTLLSVYYFAFKSDLIKKGIIIFTLNYMVFYISQYTNQLASLNSTPEATRDFTLIICSLLYFSVLVKEVSVKPLPMFWINAAVLFFFSCTFMLSLSVSYIAEVLREDFSIFWAFRNFLRVVFCFFICFGIWQLRNSKK